MSKKGNNAASVFEVILIILLVVIVAAMVFVGVVFRKNDTATSIFGYSFYRTNSTNMETRIPQKTVIVAKESEKNSVEPGDVILCSVDKYTILTRVMEVQDGAYIVKYDTAPAAETARIEKDAVIAKAVWQFEAFGKFLDFTSKPVGIIVMLMIPFAIIVIFQVSRIVRLKELEREASSIDDIDEVINRRKQEEPPAVTFTKPRFAEDVTDQVKIPRTENIGSPLVLRNPRAGSSETQEQRAKQRLTVDSNGKADFAAVKEEPVKIPENETPNERFDRIYGIKKQTSSIESAAHASNNAEPVFAAAPTRINAELAAEPQEKVVFTPHISNVIPDSLANIQEEAAVKTGFEDSVRNYFDRTPKPAPVPAEPAAESVSTIPENAVIPKENIAPVKKKKSSKTLEELMNIIDAEETKLKK